MTDSQPLPVVRLKPKSNARALRHGYPWAYENEVVADRRTRALAPGTIVRVEDGERNFVAIAAANPHSKLFLRVLDLQDGTAIGAGWLRDKVMAALALRAQLYPEPFYRLVHAEGDGLPGLIIDRFGDALVVQPNAAWIDRLLPQLCDVLRDCLDPGQVVINATGRARKSEGLDNVTRIETGQIDAPVQVPMNGALYPADLTGGQKTGLFFDQRDNHAFAARLVAPGSRVLDVFSHVGGFSMAALAAGAASALAIDASQPALDLARQGAVASGFADRFDTLKSDAFDALAALHEQRAEYDLVVCDPPAFAPSKTVLTKGLRAYERVALMAAPRVARGGYLVLCSCSHAADVSRFGNACMRGIGRAGRRGQLIHTGFAGPDHPMLPQLSENGYLKALFYRLD